MSPLRSRVVIVGGNFAGLVAASRLSCDHDVTVVDARADFEWTPNIHELLSGVKNRGGVVLPRAESVSRYGHTFIQDVVTRVDRDSSSLITESGLTLPYDACLMLRAACGQRSESKAPTNTRWGFAPSMMPSVSRADSISWQRASAGRRW